MTIINMSGGKPAKPVVVEAVEETPSTLPYTFMPKEGVDYLSSVTVGKDPNLVPGNVKKDVSIFGTVGTLESGGAGISKDIWVSPNNNWSLSIYLSFNDPSVSTEATDVPESLKSYNVTNMVALDRRYMLSSVTEINASGTVTGMYHHDAESNVTIHSGEMFNPPVGEAGVVGQNIWFALYGVSTGRSDTLHGYARLMTSANWGGVVASDSDVDVEFTMTPDNISPAPAWTAKFDTIPEFDVYFTSSTTSYSIGFAPYYLEVVS